MSWKQMILLVAVCQVALALPSTRVKREEEEVGLGGAEPNPIDTEDSLTPLDREKRKLPDAHFAAKNAVLGFVFNNGFHRSRRQTKTKVGDDIPEFDRHNVQLDVPPELFSNSFSTVTKVSDLVSRLLMNSARRYAKFALFFKPLFGDALTVEGYQDPTTTTTTTTTADNLI